MMSSVDFRLGTISLDKMLHPIWPYSTFLDYNRILLLICQSSVFERCFVERCGQLTGREILAETPSQRIFPPIDFLGNYHCFLGPSQIPHANSEYNYNIGSSEQLFGSYPGVPMRLRDRNSDWTPVFASRPLAFNFPRQGPDRSRFYSHSLLLVSI